MSDFSGHANRPDLEGKDFRSLRGLPFDLIMKMRDYPYMTCPCCDGACVHSAEIEVVPGLFMLAVRICDLCEGDGLVTYTCLN